MVGVHLVGGLVGTLLIGFFASVSVNSAGGNGLFYGGGWSQLGKQAIAAFAVMGYSFVVSLILGYIIKAAGGFRVSAEDEVSGIDEAQHAEGAYEFGGTAIGHGGQTPVHAAAPTGEALEGTKA